MAKGNVNVPQHQSIAMRMLKCLTMYMQSLIILAHHYNLMKYQSYFP